MGDYTYGMGDYAYSLAETGKNPQLVVFIGLFWSGAGLAGNDAVRRAPAEGSALERHSEKNGQRLAHRTLNAVSAPPPGDTQ
jgi:hypothetical protein